MLECGLALALSFIPAIFYATIVYFMDRFEKESKRLLVGVFLWGAIVALIGALISELILSAGTFALTRSRGITEFLGGSLYAPIIEESLKGFAVLLVFIIFHAEFDSILDGIIYAGIVALGFAAAENALYLLSAGLDGGFGALIALFFLRVVLSGWDHPMYTAFIGIGLATARLTKNFAIKIIAPLIGWMIAVAFHAAHNTLVLSLRGIGALIAFPLDWLGWLIIFGVMMWAIRREQNWLVKHLKGEIELGTINAAHYRIATSIFGRTGAWLNAIARGRVTVTRKFYQRCAELAFKKEQLENFGDEGGNASRISNLRAEIARLAPQVS